LLRSVQRNFIMPHLHMTVMAKIKFTVVAVEYLDFTIRPHSPLNILLGFYFN
jgi:hypothetical protein